MTGISLVMVRQRRPIDEGLHQRDGSCVAKRAGRGDGTVGADLPWAGIVAMVHPGTPMIAWAGGEGMTSMTSTVTQTRLPGL